MGVAWDVAIVGGGIVGLSTALALTRRQPGSRVLVLEKEARIAAHQTGHNSGVIHSGIYYTPGSLKARFATRGNRSMVAFCERHGIAHEICGKVIIATEPHELPALDRLYERGLANGLTPRKLDRTALREIEPHADGIRAVQVPTAGIVDYRAVAAAYARIVEEHGGEVLLNTRVRRLHEGRGTISIETDRATYEAKSLVICAGLHADRLARLDGIRPDFSIVPFRGEYYELKPEKRRLVRHLIYPVPNPDFPFLGVHFTRMIDGSVHAGPNAVLGLAREGYRKRDFKLRDVLDVLSYPGFRTLARRHLKEGAREVHRSFSKRAFVRSLQRLIPEIQPDDVVPTHAGVRAQALKSDGSMVDDFLIRSRGRVVHVCNAPSPAATASLEIGEAVADLTYAHATLELT